MKRLVLAAAVALAGATVVTAIGTASAANTAYAPKNCYKPRVEPSRIVFSCADFGSFFKAKTWKYWNGREAGARGKYRANDCTPSCAEGSFHNYKATIRLFKVRTRTCNGRRVPMFQKAKVHFKDKRPSWANSSERFKLVCLNL